MKNIFVIPGKKIVQPQMTSLISYLYNDLPDINSIKLNVGIKEYSDVTNNEETYVVFSLCDTKDFIPFNNFIYDIRENMSEIKFNIVVGGTFIEYIDLDDFKEVYYEVTHICVGKGEAFFKKLILDGLEQGTYYAEDFGKIPHYQYNNKLLKYAGMAFITFNDNRCSWNKCAFCHHNPKKNVRKINSVEQVVEDIHKYKLENNINTIYIYDNETTIDNLVPFLELLRKKDYYRELKFEIFGMRVSNSYDELDKILNQWNYNPFKEIAWGVEFFDDEILDLYKKGITTIQIVNSLKFFHNIGTRNVAYILLGMPLVRNSNIKNLLTLQEKYDCFIDEYRASFFRLSNKIDVYRNQEKYQIIPGDHYTIGDLLDIDELPEIKTAYMKFDSFDSDDNRWKSRTEILEKYINMNSLFGLNPDSIVIKRT
jgi:radical SAM superfamily enzyme YgiQ (UPF0313 family)